MARSVTGGIRPGKDSLIVDRRESGITDFHETFPSCDSAPIQPLDGKYHLTIFVTTALLKNLPKAVRSP